MDSPRTIVHLVEHLMEVQDLPNLVGAGPPRGLLGGLLWGCNGDPDEVIPLI